MLMFGLLYSCVCLYKNFLHHPCGAYSSEPSPPPQYILFFFCSIRLLLLSSGFSWELTDLFVLYSFCGMDQTLAYDANV